MSAPTSHLSSSSHLQLDRAVFFFSPPPQPVVDGDGDACECTDPIDGRGVDPLGTLLNGGGVGGGIIRFGAFFHRGRVVVVGLVGQWLIGLSHGDGGERHRRGRKTAALFQPENCVSYVFRAGLRLHRCWRLGDRVDVGDGGDHRE